MASGDFSPDAQQEAMMPFESEFPDSALRESEERLSLAAAAADAGLWILNEARDAFWINAKISDLFGLPPGNTLGVSQLLAQVHPDDRQGISDAMSHAFEIGKLTRVEYRLVRPDGQVRWMISRGRPYAGKEGRPVRLMGLTADITERKLRDEVIRSMEVQIASAVDVAGLGFYCMEEPGKTRFLDYRIRDLIGIPPEEEPRARDFWLARIHKEDLPMMLQASKDILENGKDRLVKEYRYRHPQRGEVWLCQRVNVMARDGAGQATRIIGMIQDITERKRKEEELRDSLEEVQRLKDQLQNENVYLREQMRSEAGNGAIIGESVPIRTMMTLARRVAPTDSAVLITGETGTGKELLAQCIHDLSSRRTKTMVKVNCAALPAPLIESELFGREKGAYTGAMTQQVGRFELADKSTIFLDEIGELHLDIQVKLLRILQDGKYERLGGHHTFKTDIRVIAATNRDLAAMVKEGRFREDLFHRLNVFPIEVAPLRERTEDIPLLVWKIVQEFNTKMGRAVDAIPKATMERLQQYPWPGNVRELRNIIERAMILSDGHSLKIMLPSAEPGSSAAPGTLEVAERAHILSALEYTHWRISGKGGAAETLGLVPTTLHSTMKRLGITRPVR
jgi:PAS domain S-box-containing protein